ncbi:hypothetical protein RDABS01_023525 [Bienertia sinuspersici]
MNVNKLGDGAKWRRSIGQELYSPLLLAFAHENSDNWKASRLTKASSMDSSYSLPLNVALITLQHNFPGTGRQICTTPFGTSV